MQRTHFDISEFAPELLKDHPLFKCMIEVAQEKTDKATLIEMINGLDYTQFHKAMSTSFDIDRILGPVLNWRGIRNKFNAKSVRPLEFAYLSGWSDVVTLLLNRGVELKHNFEYYSRDASIQREYKGTLLNSLFPTGFFDFGYLNKNSDMHSAYFRALFRNEMTAEIKQVLCAGLTYLDEFAHLNNEAAKHHPNPRVDKITLEQVKDHFPYGTRIGIADIGMPEDRYKDCAELRMLMLQKISKELNLNYEFYQIENRIGAYRYLEDEARAFLIQCYRQMIFTLNKQMENTEKQRLEDIAILERKEKIDRQVRIIISDKMKDSNNLSADEKIDKQLEVYIDLLGNEATVEFKQRVLHHLQFFCMKTEALDEFSDAIDMKTDLSKPENLQTLLALLKNQREVVGLRIAQPSQLKL